MNSNYPFLKLTALLERGTEGGCVENIRQSDI